MEVRKRWLEIGESIDDDRFEAALVTRIHSMRGTREVNRAEGTLTQDGVALVVDNPFDAHVDEGFDLLVKGLSRSEETQVLQHFEATDQGRI